MSRASRTLLERRAPLIKMDPTLPFIVGLLSLASVYGMGDLIKHLSVSEGGNLRIPHPQYFPKGGEAHFSSWTFTAAMCDAREAYITIGPTVHRDLIFGSDCDIQSHQEDIISTMKIVVSHGEPEVASVGLGMLPHVRLAQGQNETALLLYNVTVQQSGMYTLYSKNETGAGTADVFAVTVIQGGKHTPVSTMRPPMFVTPRPSIPNLSVVSTGSVLFHIGEDARTNVAIKGDNIPNLREISFTWYFVKHERGCYSLRIHEPCIFHPSEPECISPKDSKCTVTSTLNAQIIATRIYWNCTEKWRTCNYVETVDELLQGHLDWLNETDPNFKITQTTHDDSGLYILVVEVNNKVLSWGHVHLSTIDAYVSVIEDSHKPDLMPPVVKNLDNGIDAGKPSLPKQSKIFVYVCLSLAVGASLLVIIIFVVRACIRRRRLKKVVTTAYGFYSSLPTTDPFADDDTDEEDSNECNEEEIEQSRRVRRTSFSVSLGGGTGKRNPGPDYSTVTNKVGGFGED
ncbi:envelope glycoprotein E [Falconid herpesvirus 1]|uniref:Envelope glycoprotein E n=1 Tax=Falconid herpesvirus 1 TaxID=1510155 RepID=A0A068EPF3_9ALPH|nr:envelope glycoprotein E [Falconid herpesvirus 1]AID52801.1 envelope glycoprotein E [Falconid herpesvirus 1]